MTEKTFTIESERINNTYSIHIRKNGEVIFEISNWDSLSQMHKTECEELVDLLNEQDQRIKELETTIKKLVIELFNPPCVNNDDNYETLRKFLNEEYDITCTQIDIDVENEKMVLKIERGNETMTEKELTVKEMYDLLGELIEQGHGNKEFQIYYDSETVYTTIPKGSEIRISDDGVRFTDYK